MKEKLTYDALSGSTITLPTLFPFKDVNLVTMILRHKKFILSTFVFTNTIRHIYYCSTIIFTRDNLADTIVTLILLYATLNNYI